MVEEGPWHQAQQSDYEAGTVRLNDGLWRIRTARVTPKKPGAFVAVWERNAAGKTQPFSDDGITGLMVFVEEGPRFGVFRFSPSQLKLLGVTQSVSQAGKRGFRVYPSWCSELNAQASRTQQAQAASFELLE